MFSKATSPQPGLRAIINKIPLCRKARVKTKIVKEGFRLPLIQAIISVIS